MFCQNETSCSPGHGHLTQGSARVQAFPDDWIQTERGYRPLLESARGVVSEYVREPLHVHLDLVLHHARLYALMMGEPAFM